MRYLLISDIHGNLEALEKVLSLAEGRWDKALCLGDLVGYGPDPNRVIEKVRALDPVLIRGNHDRACSGQMDLSDFNQLAKMASLWTQRKLTPEHLKFLQQLPQGPLVVDWFEIFHGSWLDEDEYVVSPIEALPNLRKMPSQMGLFGHTHVMGGFMLTTREKFQSIRTIPRGKKTSTIFQLEDGCRYLVNPGSVGQPRDGDWRAGFALLDGENRSVEYIRTTYDLKKTQQKMIKSGLPDLLARRLAVGR